jgi:hypothetical protein
VLAASAVVASGRGGDRGGGDRGGFGGGDAVVVEIVVVEIAEAAVELAVRRVDWPARRHSRNETRSAWR